MFDTFSERQLYARRACMMGMEPMITLKISTFKALLLNSWDLLPPEKQQELRAIGVCPSGN